MVTQVFHSGLSKCVESYHLFKEVINLFYHYHTRRPQQVSCILMILFSLLDNTWSRNVDSIPRCYVMLLTYRANIELISIIYILKKSQVIVKWLLSLFNKTFTSDIKTNALAFNTCSRVT